MSVGARRHTAGFSLIEALIALVIIMIGLLGIAGLQALGVRNSAQAHLRTLAGEDARSLAAEIRANSAYWTDPAAPSSVHISWANNAASITPSTLASAPNCAQQTCSATQTAAYSLGQWAKSLAELPADSTVSVNLLATSGVAASSYAVTVSWTEKGMQGQGVTSANSQTHSTTVVVKP